MQSDLPEALSLHRFGGSTSGSILFLHANSFSAQMYQDFFSSLTDRYQVLAPDLPGHGQSCWSGRIHSWESLADYYLEKLDLNSVKKPIIGMGHSIGGIVILFIALKRPDLFSRIVLLDPVLPPKRFLAIMRVFRLLSIAHLNPLSRRAKRRRQVFESRRQAYSLYQKKSVFSNWKPGFLQAYVDTCFRQDEKGSVRLACSPELESSIYQSIPLQVWSLPKKISLPALFLIGDHSDTVNARGVRRLKKTGKQSQVELLNGGHLFPFENPEDSMTVIKEFLADEN
ncbi:MAG: alpha/beta hydrolase [Candidatus Marinimicrobia bacterium]|nr:alpha/beta hydrolase [Candidatus Neomarinimicrobiota bacterium]MCF7904618.1 alpha/beta hydrolase [Candidatus Neomarinimicrobiota bacterium]